MVEQEGFCVSVTVKQGEHVGVREGRRTIGLSAEHCGPQSKAVFLGFGRSTSSYFTVLCLWQFPRMGRGDLSAQGLSLDVKSYATAATCLFP